ncbi:MAG: hypothetical protein IKQ61_01065 [Spirochaetales bacterium]|nr:hypothetical protein [Spirochaetales bacterium]
MNNLLQKMMRFFIIAVILFCHTSCDLVALLLGIEPHVSPGENYIQEYNPQKAGAEIVSRHKIVKGDKAILKENKVYVLGGSSKIGYVAVYDMDNMIDTTHDCVYDVTFDISEVFQNYQYRYGKCLIPMEDKFIMLMSVGDGTNDMNVVLSMGYDGSHLAAIDISADFIRPDSVINADYLLSENRLYIYSDNYTYYNDGLILSQYSYNDDSETFSLINFCPDDRVLQRSDVFSWYWSYNSSDMVIDGDWLIYHYLNIDYYDKALQDKRICLSYLDFPFYSFDFVSSFSIDDYIWLFTKEENKNYCELIKLKLL